MIALEILLGAFAWFYAVGLWADCSTYGWMVEALEWWESALLYVGVPVMVAIAPLVAVGSVAFIWHRHWIDASDLFPHD